ncbi:DUF167 domain-containing protein [Chondromyces apiculatus]|uniref:UPF0235 protein CAP_5386 n=1 Tax=Chondromyces apiculatus DSM 436 TaxID=1192034 RepID=A0A017T469_9BACT|nr:DUF167 domain-containing protein [Chondromyces apiculatus]EYF03595.1 Hypothetical protein CAP_5386 [Chondromyces apiculatus DSM 436]
MSRVEEDASGRIDAWEQLSITDRPEGFRMSVHVRPKASRSAILGVRDKALEVALTAPPADGAANAELIRLLARALSVRVRDLEIAVGASSRSKVIAVHGLSAAEARSRLGRARR